MGISYIVSWHPYKRPEIVGMGDKNLDTSFLHLLINCYTPKKPDEKANQPHEEANQNLTIRLTNLTIRLTNLTKRLTNLTKRLTKT